MSTEAGASTIVPVILSGGSGSRLWPLSRASYPKQFHALAGRRSLLQETALRVADAERFTAPLVICNEEHRFVVAEQFREAGLEARAIVLEPEGRNTAPAAAVAALMVARDAPGAVMAVLPSDHVIGDREAFLAAMGIAAAAAAAGALVTLGVAPTAPETGYGYIRKGEAQAGVEGCYAVARFVEKPSREAAEGYLAEGGYYWNSGIFVFAAAAYLEELGRLRPAMVAACRDALERGATDMDFLRLDADCFQAAESESIDYAVMEQTAEAVVVPVEMVWSDAGSWTALAGLRAGDADGNTVAGDAILSGARNSYVRSDGPLVAAIGVEDLIIVATRDAVLVVGKDRAQDVKALVERLERDGRAEATHHAKVFRPWGSYETVDRSDRFQVKRIIVQPGAKLSLQSHRHRAEHWIVVEGTARVTVGERTFLLNRNESTFIPVGERHRLENPGEAPLHLVEVQSGDYLGEDDITRFDDSYGRA